MNLKYSILFSVELLHDYYTDKRSNDFTVVPTAETAAFMATQGMLYKYAGNQLFVLIRVDANGVPLIPLDTSKQWTFAMILNNVYFYNFTNLSYSPSQPKRYYFSNANQNKNDTDLLLHAKIKAYNNATNYAIGDLAATNAGKVYEAIKPGTGNAVTNTDAWLSRDKVQYVNTDDLIILTSFISNFAVSAATDFVVKVFGLNAAGTTYNRQVINTINLDYDTPQDTVQLRLEDIPTGKYKIDINGESNMVYIDSNLAASKEVFGIINIVNNFAAASDFGLFDLTDKPKKSRFLIRFANRSIIWRYITRTTDITSVNDSRPAVDKFTFISSATNEFLSAKPIPFNEQPVTTLFIESDALGNISSIANPTVDRLGTINKDGFDYYCAELHLNY